MSRAFGYAMLGIMAGATAISIALAAPPKPLWDGESAGFRIRWTASDLTAQGPSNFALRPIAQAGFVAIKADRGCTYSRSVRLLSVVGPYMSMRDEYQLTCRRAAHPSGEHRLTTIDLRRPAAEHYASTETEPLQVRGAVKLTDLFSEAELLAALLRNPVLKKGIAKTPATLAALQAGFPADGVEAGSSGCPFLLERDFLTRFAFHHLEGDKVAVRLALAPLGGACRGAEAELGLLLTIPPALKEALATAQSRQQGFLMEKAPKGETVIEFRRK